MPATPRPASTVVLLKDDSRIYLTKRPETMKFLGGYYVFPGGAVEEGDVLLDKQMKSPDLDNQPFPKSHYIAAIRELFEEVGIFLGGKERNSYHAFEKRKELTYRQQLVNREISLKKLLEKEELQLHLDSLQYFGHFITPEHSPIRFDTRFFLAKLPQGQTPKPDDNEIAKAFWITPEEALEAYKQKELPMAPPTVLSLKGIIDYQQGKPLRMPQSSHFNR